MKLIFGDFSVTQTKRGGYKIEALQQEGRLTYQQKKIRGVKEYFPNIAAALNRAKKLSPVDNRDIELVMEGYDKEMGNHGIEAIRDQNQWVNFWCNTRAIYSNTGDTYITTLLYDTITGKFKIVSWGDFVEKYDKKGTW